MIVQLLSIIIPLILDQFKCSLPKNVTTFHEQKDGIIHFCLTPKKGVFWHFKSQWATLSDIDCKFKKQGKGAILNVSNGTTLPVYRVLQKERKKVTAFLGMKMQLKYSFQHK